MKARLVVVCAVALAFAAPAAAKEPIRATICGASGCVTVTDKAVLREIPGGENTVALGRTAPYYEITVVNGEPNGATHSFSMYYVPSANGMAWEENGVVRLHPIYGEKATTLMRRLTAGVEPFPAPVVTAASDDLHAKRGSPWTLVAPRAIDHPPERRERQWTLGIAAAGALAILGMVGMRTGRRRRRIRTG